MSGQRMSKYVPDPPFTFNSLKWGIKKSRFEIAVKRLEIDLMCQSEANRNPQTNYRMGLSLRRPNTQKGVEKSAFHISANWLEVDANVKRAHFRTHYWLAVSSLPRQILRILFNGI